MNDVDSQSVRTHDLLEIDSGRLIATLVLLSGWWRICAKVRSSSFVVVGPLERNSSRSSWRGQKSAMGHCLSFEPRQKHPHTSATPTAQRSHITIGSHACFSRLHHSQRSLDGLQSSLGTGRQCWLRARDQHPCREAGKRSGYCSLCGKTNDSRTGEVSLRSREGSSCSR